MQIILYFSSILWARPLGGLGRRCPCAPRLTASLLRKDGYPRPSATLSIAPTSNVGIAKRVAPPGRR